MALYFNGTKIGQVGVKFEGANGTDTSDATLNSNDQLLRGTSAYSKGVKYTGTISTVSAATPTVNLDITTGVVTASVTQPKGYVNTQATKTATLTLTTATGKTITPSSTSQIAVAADTYVKGQISVAPVPTETKTITANGTYTPSAGKYFSEVTVSIAGNNPTYQTKTIIPTTTKQTINPDNGYDALSSVTVNAIQTETKSITSNGTYTPTSGKYFSSVSVNIPSSGETTPSLQTKTVSPSTSQQTITADSGYDGLSSVTINAISTQTKSVTPTTSQQTISADSGKYLTSVTVGAIQTETKSITNNGTYTPTSGKYFNSVTVNVPYQTYRTGSGAPSNSLGSDGDLYFDMG